MVVPQVPDSNFHPSDEDMKICSMNVCVGTPPAVVPKSSKPLWIPLHGTCANSGPNPGLLKFELAHCFGESSFGSEIFTFLRIDSAFSKKCEKILNILRSLQDIFRSDRTSSTVFIEAVLLLRIEHGWYGVLRLFHLVLRRLIQSHHLPYGSAFLELVLPQDNLIVYGSIATLWSLARKDQPNSQNCSFSTKFLVPSDERHTPSMLDSDNHCPSLACYVFLASLFLGKPSFAYYNMLSYQ
ncbi:hypothetical protein AVEN_272663-1 [Araneus ventricosus]|uniref:Uncharacterized protein n=1 Tax=Araneus ventricosus TaxID=182803 RepID=A0A4Y2NM04_ARAVE|nr:hypothetical protein AVEN_272663-1 [Araneus ventricosus]